MPNIIFHEGEPVIVHSLGETAPGEYRGFIRGRATTYQGVATIYIIQATDKIDTSYPFSHYTVPAACLKKVEI